MIRKLTSIPISDIVIPDVIVTETSKNQVSFISESLNDKSELFFVTVLKNNTSNNNTSKYILVDRYDVYLAAVSSKIKEISAVIISSESDCTKTHLQITVKSVINPIKIINSMRPYVEEYGLDEAINMLHLGTDFAQMYKLELSQGILDKLDGMVSDLSDCGVRSAVPLTLFTFISQLEEKQQLALIKSLKNMTTKPDSNFRWSHNTYLRKLEMGNNNGVVGKKIPEKKIPTPDIDFCCQKCDTKYVFSEGILYDEKKLKDMNIRHKNDSTPRILIPTELVEHLGVTAKNPPKIISSADIDVEKIAAQLNGRKFVIIVGKNQG